MASGDQLTDREFWRLVGLAQAEGDESVARRAGVAWDDYRRVLRGDGSERAVREVRRVLPSRS